VARAQRSGLPGVGFVLTEGDGLTGADLDDVRDPDTGAIQPWAQEVVDLAETYCEISPSERGLRLFWDGKISKALVHKPAQIEVYGRGRYLTVTGLHLEGTPTDIRPAPRTEAALAARFEQFKLNGKAKNNAVLPDYLKNYTGPLGTEGIDEEDTASPAALLNTKALTSLDRWVPDLFGDAAKVTAQGGYRVSSLSLGRNLQEDLSLSPDGIKDWGVHDLGDKREGKRTPIDVVMEHGKKNFRGACSWLRSRLASGETIADDHDNVVRLRKGRGVALKDFVAYMPKHEYIHTPTGDMWPAGSVNSRLPKMPLMDEKGEPVLDDKGKEVLISAASWLDKNRPVEQMTWAPGRPMLIRDLIAAEGGFIAHDGVTVFNLYRPPPTVVMVDPSKAKPWLDHVHKLLDEADARHFIMWGAHRLQHPEVKINHAIVIGGAPGIGKDTALEPIKRAVGSWNCRGISPANVMEQFNEYLRNVIMVINEVHDLGDISRYSFYERMKAYTAAPPDTLRINEKYVGAYNIQNCCGVVLTTNYKQNGMYLPADDRRNYVAWSDRTKEDFEDGYFDRFYAWLDGGGDLACAAYLAQLDLSSFNPKAPPPKTAAFWEIVDSNRAPEENELDDLLDGMDKDAETKQRCRPRAVTLDNIKAAAREARDGYEDKNDIANWLEDRRNARAIPHRLERCGYVAVRNDVDKAKGLWLISGRRQTIYALASLSGTERIRAASELKAKDDQRAERYKREL
jgi:hypothetical protein